MKRILITGEHSYLGGQLAQYLAQWPAEYAVTTVSVQDEEWKQKSFAGYDCVFHVAGIAHADVGRVSEERKAEYYRVNTDLAVETAQKAKADGVRQFIFMSSIIIYGASAPIGKEKHITAETVPQPENFYGDTKLQAEKGILPLSDSSFRVVILRLPMIYGKGSRGNYPTLSRLAQKLPVFPAIRNRRSVLYVGNLTEFVRIMIDREEQGIFWPQNREYAVTSEMVREIAAVHGRKVLLIPGFQWLLRLLAHGTELVNKAFGSLTYDMSMSAYPIDYRKYDFSESIRKTEE